MLKTVIPSLTHYLREQLPLSDGEVTCFISPNETATAIQLNKGVYLFLNGEYDGKNFRQEKVVPMIGQTIQGFILEELIGEGGTGLVFRCSRGTQNYALKFYDEYLTYKVESNIMIMLYKLGIPQIHYRMSIGNYGFVVMDYFPKTLSRNIPKTGDELMTCLLQIVQSLKKIHGVGFVHCDIKGSNVCLNEENKAFLIDFGLCKQKGRILKNRDLATYCFRHPYICRANLQNEEFEVHGSIDMWAFGIMVFELIKSFPKILSEQNPSLYLQNIENAKMPKMIFDMVSKSKISIDTRQQTFLCSLLSKLLVVDYKQVITAEEAEMMILDFIEGNRIYETCLIEDPPTRIKQRQCKHFLRGCCKNGDSCLFSHEKQICKYFLQRKCKYGDSCKNIHQ